MLAIKTLRVVNRVCLTAFGAFPPFFFGSHKLPYAEISDIFEIGDHAHAALGSIPLTQMIQPVAGEPVTTKAALDFSVHHHLYA